MVIYTTLTFVRDGINKAGDFLRNICAQLIAVYNLDYKSLPPETTQDLGFLNRLLNAVSEKMGQSGKCVIVVDALDEAEDLTRNLARMSSSCQEHCPKEFLSLLHRVVNREKRYSLRIDIPEQVRRDLKQDEPGNSKDIAEYIKGQVSNPGIQAYIHRQHIDDELFVGHLVDKAQGNFIYLHYVLPEIECGHYQDLALDQIPEGLQNYYESHWQRIKRENGLDWFDYRLPVVLALTVMKKPVSITLIMHYSDVNDKRRVKEVLHDFEQFLYKVEIEYDRHLTTCYRWYHASFFDFVGRKEEVAEEVVDLRKAAEKVTNKMWTDLMGDTPTFKPTQE